jgi:hypothetical protein
MWTALVRKEAREALAVVAAGAALYLFLVAEAMNLHIVPDLVRNQVGLSFWGRKPIPFLGGAFTLLFTVVSGMLAFVLGLWQTVGETRRDTYALLLHLPMPRGRIIAAKLATGLALYLILAALPILALAWWAATPGTHASPFDWSMTEAAWRWWLAMATIYLAAFLSGLRPARWFGTRLLPVLAAASLIVLVDAARLPGLLYGAALVLFDAVLVVEILFVAQTRDYS